MAIRRRYRNQTVKIMFYCVVLNFRLLLV